MRRLQTEVLVIGGGATGVGVARDLALRGFKTILVERRDLAYGATGHYHGLLHSGGRYVVKDPLAAQACIAENRILRQIMPECIEDTGGFFVLTPADDPAYVDRFVTGCQQANIPCEELSISQMLREEPNLNPNIQRCFRLPDGAADSFLAADLNAEDAQAHGAQILTYHEVLNLWRRDGGVAGALCYDLVSNEDVQIEASLVINAAGAWAGKVAASAGAQVEMAPGKGTLIAVAHRIVNTVINRCKLPGDGDILVPAHTVAVIGTTDVGASCAVPDPDCIGIEAWEVALLLDQGEKIIPGFKQLRMLRAWAGVRPLYQPKSGSAANRELTREFVLLDHETRDGVENFLTITGGKWTTYRKMAEVTVDKVCEKLKTSRPCRTHLEALSSAAQVAPRRTSATTRSHSHTQARQPDVSHHLGHSVRSVRNELSELSEARLQHVEQEQLYGQLICECELATRAQVEQAILVKHARTIDDIRRDVRLGMGPCQGSFCTFRVAGILHQLAGQAALAELASQSAAEAQADPPQTEQPSGAGIPSAVESVSISPHSVFETNLALHDFLQERWKGLTPILWGQQLRQERLNELIYVSLLNAGRLPGPGSSPKNEGSRFKADMYKNEVPGDVGVNPAAPRRQLDSQPTTEPPPAHQPHPGFGSKPFSTASRAASPEALVIGAGMAGLVTAWQAAEKGRSVRVIAKGWGATHWGAGCIDVLGYYPSVRAVHNEQSEPLESSIRNELRRPLDSPLSGVESLIQDHPQHPYAWAGVDRLEAALRALQTLCAEAGYPMHGTLSHNWWLPSALGAIRPTCLAPETMIEGDLRRRDPMLIIGFLGYHDFYPGLIADNLNAQAIFASALMLDLPSLRGRKQVTGMMLARLFDTPAFRFEVAEAVKSQIGDVTRFALNCRIGFPAVLGLKNALQAQRDLSERLGRPVFEIPTIPPSIPGMRLHTVLVSAIERLGGRVWDGMQVTGMTPAAPQDETIETSGDGAANPAQRIAAVWSEAAARRQAHRAKSFVLATGGILGGGFQVDYPGYAHDTALGLPLSIPNSRSDWLNPRFLAPEGHPIFQSGFSITRNFQPADDHGQPLFDNLFAVGGALGHCDPLRERAIEGLALVSGYCVGNLLAQALAHGSQRTAG